MQTLNSDEATGCVLVLAPTGRDAPLIAGVLGEAGVSIKACDGIEHFCRELSEDVGAAFITEEALTSHAVRCLVEALGAQPQWSDFPLVVLTSSGESKPLDTGVLKTLLEVGNVTLVERPTRIITLFSALRAALRARRRQYEVRDHLVEQKRAQEERTRLLTEAEEANRTKDEFLATMSHELRTPLTAILGWTHLLRSNTFAEKEFARALETIERNARVQTKLIDDLLDISRIITGKLRLDARPVDLGAVIAATVEATRPTAEAKEIRLQMLVNPLAGLIKGDNDRLQQIVWNLLTNAIKFTPKGGLVQVRLERADSHAKLIVSDSGDGINPEFLPHVFDRFRQADGTTTRVHGGLGLGLSIVRQLVELHGGTVAAESEGEGKGASFIVQLPLLLTRGETGAATRSHLTAGGLDSPDSHSSLAGLRILVVDDEADARDMIQAVLELCGSEVTTADSALAALKIMERSKPDVLISDIGMPSEDGYFLISKVRAAEAGSGERIPAIALTAYARVEDRIRALHAGFQVHVPKPIEPVELVAVVASLTGRTGKK
jgi:signal transduction histidine kinase/ActR/RegA family two-component response regulator